MTHDQRKALKRARRLIESGDETYICWALQRVAREDWNYSIACTELEEYVVKALGGRDETGCSPSLETWQRKNGFPRRDRRHGHEDRLAWIAWMLMRPRKPYLPADLYCLAA